MIIVIGDIHLTEDNIEEINSVFKEILEENQDATEFWLLGDTYDRTRPSPLEIDVVTKILTDLLKVGKVTLITGNHDELSTKFSAVHYTKHFGVDLYENKVIKKVGSKQVLLGHFFTDMTEDVHCKGETKVSDLESNYDLTLLGHYHNFQKMGSHTYHLGSLIRINFKETAFSIPKIARICPKTLKIDFRDVKSAIPMYEVNSCQEALQKPNMSKIRVIFKGFEQFKAEANIIPECQKKFHTFKVKLDFKNIVERTDTIEDKKIKSFDEIFNDFLVAEIKDNEVKNIIESCL